MCSGCEDVAYVVRRILPMKYPEKSGAGIMFNILRPEVTG